MNRKPLPPKAAMAENKQRGRPWQPGQSGNPAGRKKGHRSPALAALDAIGHENAEAIVAEVVKQALEGDMVAARIILDRCWPAPKGRLISLNLPKIDTLAGLHAAYEAVNQALSSAIITIDEAAAVINLLENKRRIFETIHFEARLIALEKGVKK